MADGKFTLTPFPSTQVDVEALRRWLSKARDIQWDYKNIVKRKGRLERIK